MPDGAEQERLHESLLRLRAATERLDAHHARIRNQQVPHHHHHQHDAQSATIVTTEAGSETTQQRPTTGAARAALDESLSVLRSLQAARQKYSDTSETRQKTLADLSLRGPACRRTSGTGTESTSARVSPWCRGPDAGSRFSLHSRGRGSDQYSSRLAGGSRLSPASSAVGSFLDRSRGSRDASAERAAGGSSLSSARLQCQQEKEHAGGKPPREESALGSPFLGRSERIVGGGGAAGSFLDRTRDSRDVFAEREATRLLLSSTRLQCRRGDQEGEHAGRKSPREESALGSPFLGRSERIVAGSHSFARAPSFLDEVPGGQRAGAPRYPAGSGRQKQSGSVPTAPGNQESRGVSAAQEANRPGGELSEGLSPARDASGSAHALLHHELVVSENEYPGDEFVPNLPFGGLSSEQRSSGCSGAAPAASLGNSVGRGDRAFCSGSSAVPHSCCSGSSAAGEREAPRRQPHAPNPQGRDPPPQPAVVAAREADSSPSAAQSRSPQEVGPCPNTKPRFLDRPPGEEDLAPASNIHAARQVSPEHATKIPPPDARFCPKPARRHSADEAGSRPTAQTRFSPRSSGEIAPATPLADGAESRAPRSCPSGAVVGSEQAAACSGRRGSVGRDSRARERGAPAHFLLDPNPAAPAASPPGGREPAAFTAASGTRVETRGESSGVSTPTRFLQAPNKHDSAASDNAEAAVAAASGTRIETRGEGSSVSTPTRFLQVSSNPAVLPGGESGLWPAGGSSRVLAPGATGSSPLFPRQLHPSPNSSFRVLNSTAATRSHQTPPDASGVKAHGGASSCKSYGENSRRSPPRRLTVNLRDLKGLLSSDASSVGTVVPQSRAGLSSPSVSPSGRPPHRTPCELARTPLLPLQRDAADPGTPSDPPTPSAPSESRSDSGSSSRFVDVRSVGSDGVCSEPGSAAAWALPARPGRSGAAAEEAEDFAAKSMRLLSVRSLRSLLAGDDCRQPPAAAAQRGMAALERAVAGDGGEAAPLYGLKALRLALGPRGCSTSVEWAGGNRIFPSTRL
ncbi:hypothetical protein DIPPA_27766 [Diplonema papillatum]|nr:hypothetical protein DIPPA_27766 [Diplonema papillatum]